MAWAEDEAELESAVRWQVEEGDAFLRRLSRRCRELEAHVAALQLPVLHLP